ncbi:MAG TPA: hypothetical protein PLA43_11670 [Bryobacteraceae bacterium]|nr:hypothetical protein [Bryobacteraceae bacterium]HOQ46448.1 hypothetical protein [Bryobacteraceae bacterium]HPQ17204.1 hypothetical protein [Bryobacteraceae bacterium]HPU72607.1 hypothetical protein [Bryobacteraceae bacterium]
MPAGLFFLGLGLILTVYGLLVPAQAALVPDVNVNLYCGAAMGVFGLIMLLMAWRRSS